jgi:hypothetical protein
MAGLFDSLTAFVARYGLFLLGLLVGLGFDAWKIYRLWKRRAEMLDPNLTPEWADRRYSILRQRVQGLWQGRVMTLRRFRTTERSRDAVEATLEIGVRGRLILERGDSSALKRTFRIGTPPVVPLTNPEDQRLLRAYSEDVTLPERLLANPAARTAILACLREPADEITLRRAKLRVRCRFPKREPAAPVMRRALTALEEVSRVLG